MAKRNFDEWLATFTDNINSYTYYVDFEGVYANSQVFKRELALMQTLIGSKNIREEFKDLVTDYPEVIKCIPILLALRDTVIAVTDEDGRKDYDFKKMNYSLDDYCDFVLEFMSKMELVNPIIIGHSHGGRVTMKLTADGKVSPPKIVLLDAAGLIPKKSFKQKVRARNFKIIKKVLTTN